jgi:hypothetical protein
VFDDREIEWTCPLCGENVRFIGPATRARFIEDHNYWKHEKPERDRRAYQQRLEWQRSREAKPTDLDDAFYDGARLTGTDLTFLKSVAACWNRPA